MKRFVMLACAVAVLAGCDSPVIDPQPPLPPFGDAALRQSLAQAGVIPIGDMPPQNAATVALGRALFFDPILSGNKDTSCGSCHQPDKALGDGLSLPVGTARRMVVPRHAPSLLNSGLGMFYLFWDGRLRSNGARGNFLQPAGIPIPSSLSNLVAQAMLPVLNRQEMRGNPGDLDVQGQPNELALISDRESFAVWGAVMKRLAAIPEYVTLFSAAFPNRAMNQLTFEDAAHAIATFQMEAFTKVQSPFDRYLKRDDNALSPEQKRGAQLFFGRAFCSQCHGGPFLGGQTFANVGAPQIGPGGTKQPPLDLGRNEVENVEFYKFAFRAPPLRNVELTAPYMHSGAYKTLEAVVEHYNNVQQALRTYDVTQLDPALRAQYHGEATTINAVLATLDPRLRQSLNLSDAEKQELVAFLKSLTDPAARNLASLKPARVPSGLVVQ